MENLNRRSFIGAATTFALFAGKIEAQQIERGTEDILHDIEALKTSLAGLEQEMSLLGLAYGDHFRNNSLDQLDQEALQSFRSFLERAEVQWKHALDVNNQVQELVQGTTITQYEQYGMSDHPNVQILRSFAELKPNHLTLLPLRMNIAREALGEETIEYNSPF